MSSTTYLALTVLIFLQINDSVERSEDRVSSKIYKNIGGVLACFRRMNGTHQIGCSSSLSGEVGVIHIVNDTVHGAEEFDVNWITSSGPHSPYIAVLYPSSFRRSILDKLKSSGRVKGILLLRRNGTNIAEFSGDKSCPNRGYGFYRNPTKDFYCSKWDDVEETNELLFRDWGFPIFYVPENAESKDKYGIDSIVDCFEKYNKPIDKAPREWPLCAAQLSSFMNAAVDTPTCVRRGQFSALSITQRKDCDPLGDRNLVASLIPSNQTIPHPDRSVIVIAARLDSASMFDAMNPGADTVASGITAVLATLKQLHEIKEQLQNSDSDIKNVYFVLFNGEAFDYIGSSRVVYDMSLDKFPLEITDNTTYLPALLRMKDIKYYIELNQVALKPTGSYYIHQNLDSGSATGALSPLIQRIVSNGQSQRIRIEAVQRQDWQGVPPSSLQSFLSNSSDFPGIVITNHKKEFSNKHYNSIFDDERNIDVNEAIESIAGLATTVACTVEGLIKGNNAPCSISKDTKLVENILPCYVVSGKCELFKNVSSAEVAAHLREKPNYYVGVSSTIDLLSMTSHTKNIMVYFQGDIVTNRTEESCHAQDEKTMNLAYMYFNGTGECYETTLISTHAVSPAFEIHDYDWRSGQYSTWSESVWSKMTVRIFLKPSFIHELTTFLSGLIVFGLSFVLVGWISRKTDIIFPSRPEQIC